MPTEINGSKPRATDFTLDKTALFIRKMPLRLALQLQGIGEGDVVPPDIVADAIYECVVSAKGDRVFKSPDAVLDADFDVMTKLFAEVSVLLDEADAAKN